MPWNEEQQRQARLMSSGSWPKREARKTTFRDVLRALGIASSPLDLTSQEPEGVRPDYGLTGAGLERRRRYPGEYFPGEATQADVAGALWNIVESAGVENLPGIGPHKTAKQAPGRVRPGHEAEFNEWFRGSKAVDAEGKPSTLYHGSSTSGFTEFNRDKASPGLFGRGFYFTSDPTIAGEYSTVKGDKSASGVLPAHVAIAKPYDMEDYVPAPDARRMVESIWRQAGLDPNDPREGHARLTKVGKRLIGQAEEGNLDGRSLYYALTDNNSKDAVTRAMRDAGFDGITHEGGRIMGTRPHKVWIAFNPDQIKSATGNRGTYSRDSADIRE